MTASELIEIHPLVFKEYFEKFAPLSHEFLREYDVELTWSYVSENQAIDWADSFIELYQDRIWWPYFIKNPALVISLEFLRKYGKRMELDGILCNPEIIDPDKVLTAYKRLRLFADHPLLTESLRQKYADRIVPGNRTRTLNKENTEGKAFLLSRAKLMDPDARGTFDFSALAHELEPYLEETFIRSFMNNLYPYPGAFVEFKPAFTDAYGLTPSFGEMDEFRDSSGNLLLDVMRTLNYIPFRQGHGMEGKFRLLHCIGTGSTPRFPRLLVSDALCDFLQTLRLPQHERFRVRLTTKKGEEIYGYSLLVFSGDSLFDGYETEERVRVVHYAKSSDLFRPVVLIKDRFLANYLGTYEEVSSYFRQFGCLSKQWGVVNFTPRVKKDIYTILGRIYMTNSARIKLENSGFGPFKWQSIFPSTIVPEPDYSDHERLKLVKRIPPPSFKKNAATRFFEEKRKRLEELGRVTINDLFVTAEVNAMLADRKSLTVRTSVGAEQFRILSPGDREIVNDYADRFPETYNCCTVATNGVGDYLAFLLEKESDYRLSDNVVLLNHDSGEVEAVKILS